METWSTHRDNQVQPAGSMALVLEGAIADFAESVETDGPSHGVVCFAPGVTPSDPPRANDAIVLEHLLGTGVAF